MDIYISSVDVSPPIHSWFSQNPTNYTKSDPAYSEPQPYQNQEETFLANMMNPNPEVETIEKPSFNIEDLHNGHKWKRPRMFSVNSDFSAAFNNN